MTLTKNLIIVVCLFLSTSLFGQNEIEWENLPVPHISFTKIVQVENKLFMGSFHGLHLKNINEDVTTRHPDIGNEYVIDIEILGSNIYLYTHTYPSYQSNQKKEFKIYLSIDGGTSFKVVNTQESKTIYIGCSTYNDPYEIYLADDHVMYSLLISGDGCFSQYYFDANYSLDGGQTWSPFNSPEFTHATSDGNGTYYLARQDKIFWSTDPTFATYQSNDTTIEADSISVNGGVDYVPVRNSPILAFEYMNGTIYIYYKTKLLTSTDNGATWTEQALPMHPEEFEQNNGGKSATRLSDGYFYYINNDLVFRTKDPLASPWESFNLAHRYEGNVDINLVYTPDEGYIYSDVDHPIYISKDEGNSWKVSSWSGIGVTRLEETACINGNIWIEGFRGSIFKSTDDFYSWENYKTRINGHPANLGYKVFFVEHKGNVYAMNGNFNLIMSEDDGTTWTVVPSHEGRYHIQKLYASEDKLYTIGRNEVSFSSDKGTTWTTIITTDDDNEIEDVTEINDIIVVDTESDYFYTKDDGQTWQNAFPDGSRPDICDFYFCAHYSLPLWTDQKWYHMTKDGTLYTSTNQGATWTQTGQSFLDLGIGSGSNEINDAFNYNGLLFVKLRYKFDGKTYPFKDFISKDDGKNWTEIDFPSYVSRFFKDGKIYIGGGILARADMEDIAALIPDNSDNIDLALTFETATPNPNPWQNISLTLTISNDSQNAATEIEVAIPQPNGMPLQSGNEYQASQGTYDPYGNAVWQVGNLAAGASATLTLNLFSLDPATADVYAQVIAANETDSDSSPANGDGFSSNEDDEVAFSFGGNDGNNPTCVNANIDFENGESSWNNFGSFSVDCNDSTVGCVGKVIWNEGGFGMAQSLAVKPNTSITVSAIAKVDLPSNDANIGVKFLDANYAELYQEQERITSDVYQSYELTTTVPSNAVFAYAYAYKTDLGNSLYVDQLCLQTENNFDNNPQFRLHPTATNLTANVYPNPFKEEIRIELDLPKTSQLTITLVNTLGQTVKTVTQTSTAGQQQLEIASNDLPSGTYYLQIRTSDDLLTKKLVKL